MSALKWETPEPTDRGRGKGNWAAIVAELQARPGQWALVAEGVHVTLAAYLKRRYGVETTMRDTGSGRASKLYARWPEAVES